MPRYGFLCIYSASVSLNWVCVLSFISFGKFLSIIFLYTSALPPFWALRLSAFQPSCQLFGLLRHFLLLSSPISGFLYHTFLPYFFALVSACFRGVYLMLPCPPLSEGSWDTVEAHMLRFSFFLPCPLTFALSEDPWREELAVGACN